MGASPQSIQLLHVDDDLDLAEMAAEFLQRSDDRISVDTVTSANEALDQLGANDYDCIVSDYEMPGQNGIQLLKNVRDEYPDLPFILYTGKGSEEVASDAISAGVTDYLQKGSGTSQYEVLANRIQNAVEQQRAREEAAETEHELRQERAFTTAALEGVVDFYWAIDLDGYVTRWSDTGGSVTGYTAEEAIGLHTSTFHPDDHFPRIEAAIEEIKEGGYTQVEADLLRKDGERRHYSFTGIALTDENGEIYSMCGTGRDITERKERVEEIERLKDRFQAFTELASDIITVVDETGHIQYQSPSVERVLGYEPEDLIGTTAFEHVHPDDQESLVETFDTVVGSPGSMLERVTYRFKHADGSWVWLESVGSNRTNCAIYGYVITSRDITEQVERERNLDHYRTLVETDGDPMYTLDADGYIDLVDGAMTTHQGTDESSVHGTHSSKDTTDGDFEPGREGD